MGSIFYSTSLNPMRPYIGTGKKSGFPVPIRHRNRNRKTASYAKPEKPEKIRFEPEPEKPDFFSVWDVSNLNS